MKQEACREQPADCGAQEAFQVELENNYKNSHGVVWDVDEQRVVIYLESGQLLTVWWPSKHIKIEIRIV